MSPTIPPNVRAIRLARGLTLRRFAVLTGVDPANVSRVERGLVASWPKFRRSAAAVLGVDESVLFPEAKS